MSSLHHSHLLVEGPEPVKGDGSTLASARGTSRRSAEEKASKVPTQRQGKAQQTGTDSTIADGSTPTSSVSTARPAGRKSAAPAAGTLAARAKAAAATKAAATTKAATSKAATAAAAKVSTRTAAGKPAAAKPATAKATPVAAKPAAAPVAKVAPVAKTTAAAQAKPAPAAKPAAVKATRVAKPAPAAKKAAAKATPAAAARPTPYKRPTPVEPAAEAVVVETTPQADVVSSEDMATEFLANEIVASVAEGRRTSFLRRRPPSIRRRPSLYLAAALVGAIGVSGFSSGDPAAQAMENVSHSVSVAEELGITAEPTEAITDTHAAERLGELAVSRNVRGAEQAAAAQVQNAADQAAAAAAAEAARPDAVMPVNGARLTSTYGARWGTLHAGIDLAAPMRTPEMAVMDGVVLEAGPASGFGLAVYIQHENGDVTVYGHMDEILVEAGQVVRAGDTIALLGNRGQSTGPHLHFEVHVGGLNGEKIDPLPWLRERGVAI